MKQQLEWTEIGLPELAAHLQSAAIVQAQALGNDTLYHCQHADRETIAIARADGGLIIGLRTFPSESERRKTRQRPAL